MKSIVSYILLIAILASCGVPGDRTTTGYKRENELTDMSFDYYVREFEIAHEKYTGNTISVRDYDIPINFGVPEKNYVGACITYGNGSKEILILSTTWNTYSELKRRQLIFHELGHCVLGRHHNDTVYPEDSKYGKKISLMSSTLLYDTIYKPNQTELENELFTKDTSLVISAFAANNY